MLPLPCSQVRWHAAATSQAWHGGANLLKWRHWVTESRILHMSKVTFTVNGSTSTVEVEPRTLLADALRDELGLTGTHIGCDTSQCGCCTVRMDGSAVKSCTMLAVQAEGSRIDTIEGLADVVSRESSPATQLHPVQQAFSSCHALQCGFCTPGMIMATVELLDQYPDPTDDQIREGLSGNLCRCTGYVNIENAVKEAAAKMRSDRITRGGDSTPRDSVSRGAPNTGGVPNTRGAPNRVTRAPGEPGNSNARGNR